MPYKILKKIAALLLIAVCSQSAVFADGIKQTPKIKNLSVDTFDGVIKWEYDGEYEGAQIYKVNKAGALINMGTTTNTAYTYDSQGTYLVKAVNADESDYGSFISYSEELTFTIALNDVKFSEMSAEFDLSVANNNGVYSGGVLDVSIYDIEGETISETQKNMIMKGESVKNIKFTQFSSGERYKTVISLWDGLTGRNDIAEPITIVIDNPTESYVQSVIEKNKSNAAQLLELINECKEKDIPTAYEYANYKITDRFTEYLQEDLANGEFDNVYYTENALDKIYEETKNNLRAYLSGEKTAVSVPKYKSGSTRIDGMSIYADSQTDGEDSGERPTYFIGYGHFDQAMKDVSFFEDIGANTIQLEIGPSNAWVFTPHFADWESAENASYTVTQDTESYKDGTASARIVSGESNSGRITISQKAAVEAGKTYTLTAYVQSHTKATGISCSADGFLTSTKLNGKYDWKKVTLEYTAPEGTDFTTIGFNISGDADFYIDGVTFTEKNSDVNLIKNGGFETKSDLAYTFDPFAESVKEVCDVLAEAEKSNISVTMLLSPHYFPQKIIDMYGIELPNSTAFIKYIIDAPEAKAVIERFMRGIIPLASQYKSLGSICISNEPSYELMKAGDFYLEQWQEFLKKRYDGDISKLNKSYGSSYSSFEDVKYKHIWITVDYAEFTSGIFGAWHKRMADIAKEEAPHIPVHSKIMNYLSGGNSKNVDALYNGTNYAYYDFQDLNGCDAGGILNEDKKYLEESLWYDYIRSIKDTPVVNSEDHIIADGSKNYNADVADHVAELMYMGAIHGRAVSDMWVWERSYDEDNQFNGSILFRPDVISAVSKTTMDLNRNAYYIKALAEQKADVGILYSDASILLDKTAKNSLYQAYAAAVYNGKNVKFIIPSQLAKLGECKAVIVPDTKYVTAETVSALKEYLTDGGKLILMGGDCFKYDEKKNPNDAESIASIYAKSDIVEYVALKNGILNSSEEKLYSDIRNVLKSYGLFYVEIKNSADGKTVNNVEYNLGVYDGKLILNLVNYEEAKTVNIYVNGTLVKSAENINANESVSENVRLEKYIPVTLEIDGFDDVTEILSK